MLNAHNLEEKPDEIDTEIGGTADSHVSRKGIGIILIHFCFKKLKKIVLEDHKFET